MELARAGGYVPAGTGHSREEKKEKKKKPHSEDGVVPPESSYL